MRVLTPLVVVLLVTMVAIGDDVSDFATPEIQVEPLETGSLSETQADKLYAATLFGHARLEQRRRQFANALQLYQRAWRYDRSVVSISNELIPLAMGLQRSEEAARYAGLVISDKALDGKTLMRMAVVLTRNGKYDKAIQAYQTVLARQNDSSVELPKALISAELGRTALLAQKNDLAALAFDSANTALQHPNESGLTSVQVAQLKGATGAVFLAMNEAYQATKQFDKARKAINQAQQIAPNTAMHSLRLARLLLAEAKPQEAHVTLQKYFDSKSLQAKSDPYRLLIKINQTLYSDQAKADALSIEHLQNIQQTQTSNHYVGYSLAEIALATGDADLAMQPLRKYLPIQPILGGYQNAVDALLFEHSQAKPITESAAIELAWILGTVYSRSRSLNSLEQPRIFKIISDKTILRRLAEVTYAYAVQDQIPENTNIGLKSFSSHTAAAMALLFSQAKDWPQAKRFFELAIAEAPGQSGMVYENWGVQLLMNDQPEPAIKVLETALDSEYVRNKPAIHFLISGAYVLNSQNQKAINSSKIAAEQANDNPRLLSRYPWVLYHTGQLKQARQEYAQLINKLNNLKATPNTLSIGRDARLTLSILCQRLGQPEDAVEWLEQVLDSNPEDLGALNDLGYLWAERNEHLLRAEQMTTRAVAGDPNNAAYRDSLGWAYYRLGKFNKAKAEFDTARKLNNNDGVIYDHLAHTYLQLGDQQQARKMWQRALNLLDTQKDAQQIELIRKKIEKLRCL